MLHVGGGPPGNIRRRWCFKGVTSPALDARPLALENFPGAAFPGRRPDRFWLRKQGEVPRAAG